MRRILFSSLAFLFLWVSSCSTVTPPPAPEVVSVYSSPFTQTWLAELYGCAGSDATLVRVDDAHAADISLQIGEPEFLSGFAYQIDEEEILIATNRASPIRNLTLEQTQALFMGLGDPSVQVWVYASGAEAQKVFDQFVMEGRSVTPSAKAAASPQQMSDVLVSELNAVGVLPRHWMAGDPSTGSGQVLQDVYSAATVPVLALTNVEPQGVVKELIGCLQK